MKTILLLFFALMALVPPASADWRPVERIEHYAVTGATGIDLYRSIGENGPSVGIGRAIAYTDFDLLWSRDYRQQSDGSCVLASARPSLTITYRLPRPAGPLPPHTQRLWDVFIAGVEKHERVHGEIILDMTRQIEAVSVGLRAENDPGCQKVRAELQRKLVGISEERHARNREFDRVELSEGGNVHQLVLALVNG
ncbi:DUF922 domain-containing protein [Chelativorans sp. ZYF759]|uniref:DUF922 domain-containing Zn-dependent protease n=1 Tax=Chelativorans sp. ZYF759 TaxID=2692213 RepID=UPI00145DDC6F|nr:DUF922 domain-containing protein [Chelativorans sp. ZYF759]NMG39015.1 DUF922 domain-containing protein [Chelativorans sp. ZYF759]